MSEPKPIQKRNVIVLGKTGSGKSSVANKITGSEDNFKVSGGTTVVSHCEVEMEDPESEVKYNFKIIDTIGLFDNSPDGIKGKKTNQIIMEEIKKYLSEIIPEGITLVIFVFRKGRFTKEEEDTFKFITENFRGDISEISALVITNCENDNDVARQDIIEDFKNNAGPIANFMTKGIYTVGFPDVKTMKPKLRAAFQDDIEKDTEKLRDLVKKSGEMRPCTENHFPLEQSLGPTASTVSSCNII